MKKIAIAILSLMTVSAVAGLNASAQGKYGATPEDSIECVKYLSYYKEYYKQKSYDDALPNWRKAYQLCPPQASQNLFLDGATLLRRVITKNMKNTLYKDALVDSLMTLHDQRAANYPANAEAALNAKGTDMFNYIKDDSKRLYAGYSDIIAKNGPASKPTFYLYNFNAAVDLYNGGTMTVEDILNLYQSSMEGLEKVTVKTDADKEALAKVKTDLESLFISSKVASCDDLISLFTPRYDADPNNLDLVSKIVKMMSTAEGCLDNDLYLNAVTSMYKLDPSYTSAYFLYKLNSSRGNADEAVKYLEEAIAYEESDDAQDGDYNLELATYCYKNNMNAKAFDAAKKAVELTPANAGRAYMLMGTIWGSTRCSGNEIEVRAPYWVAVDYLQKAKAADETLAEEANRLISSFSSYFPNTGDAFMYGFNNGDSYTVNCGGLRATTTVRTQK